MFFSTYLSVGREELFGYGSSWSSSCSRVLAHVDVSGFHVCIESLEFLSLALRHMRFKRLMIIIVVLVAPSFVLVEDVE